MEFNLWVIILKSPGLLRKDNFMSRTFNIKLQSQGFLWIDSTYESTIFMNQRKNEDYGKTKTYQAKPVNKVKRKKNNQKKNVSEPKCLGNRSTYEIKRLII